LLRVGISAVVVLPAQSPDALDWRTVAGTSQKFEVASAGAATIEQLPKWATTDSFEIEARAAAIPPNTERG